MQGVPMRPHNALFLGESRPVPSTFGSKLRITEKPESNQKSDTEIANRLSSNAIPAKKWKMRMSLKPGFLLCNGVATLHRTAPTAQGWRRGCEDAHSHPTQLQLPTEPSGQHGASSMSLLHKADARPLKLHSRPCPHTSIRTCSQAPNNTQSQSSRRTAKEGIAHTKNVTSSCWTPAPKNAVYIVCYE